MYVNIDWKVIFFRLCIVLYLLFIKKNNRSHVIKTFYLFFKSLEARHFLILIFFYHLIQFI